MIINKEAKRILVYGDSLTWGRVPSAFERFDVTVRYPGVLQRELSNKYEIIEEGLRSRMAKGENPFLKYRNGYAQFPPIFASHMPLEGLIIFLGTNDTNRKSDKSAEQITEDLRSYLHFVEEMTDAMDMSPPQFVLYIVPPIINPKYLKENSKFEQETYDMAKLRKLIPQMVSTENGGRDFACFAFDSNEFVAVSQEDGVHIGASEQVVLGKELARVIEEIPL
jgi:lysophospholipase L1-like esterase